MRAILLVFVPQHLLDASGAPHPMSEKFARGRYQPFVPAVFFTPLLDALLSDRKRGAEGLKNVSAVRFTEGHSSDRRGRRPRVYRRHRVFGAKVLPVVVTRPASRRDGRDRARC